MYSKEYIIRTTCVIVIHTLTRDRGNHFALVGKLFFLCIPALFRMTMLFIGLQVNRADNIENRSCMTVGEINEQI